MGVSAYLAVCKYICVYVFRLNLFSSKQQFKIKNILLASSEQESGELVCVSAS